MKKAVCTLQSITPYSQSRFHNSPKLEKELADNYEERTWREKCHTDSKGEIFIPPMAFANALKEAARFMSIQIPGKGKATYTKHFEAGVMVFAPLPLGVKKSEVKGEWIYCHADGQRGSGRRVMRCFPVIPEWRGVVEFLILDDLITSDVFEEVLFTSGQLIGIGRFRPINLGFNGRYLCKAMNFKEEGLRKAA
jgi:hypothetical protein